MLEYWQMLPIGVVIASIAMFFGLGGGVLWMPVLLMSTDLEPKGAVVCTIVIQFFGQFSATYSNNQAGLIDWRLVRLLMAFGIPAVIFGVLFSFLLHPVWIELVLGLTIFLLPTFFCAEMIFLLPAQTKQTLRLRVVAA